MEVMPPSASAATGLPPSSSASATPGAALSSRSTTPGPRLPRSSARSSSGPYSSPRLSSRSTAPSSAPTLVERRSRFAVDQRQQAVLAERQIVPPLETVWSSRWPVGRVDVADPPATGRRAGRGRRRPDRGQGRTSATVRRRRRSPRRAMCRRAPQRSATACSRCSSPTTWAATSVTEVRSRTTCEARRSCWRTRTISSGAVHWVNGPSAHTMTMFGVGACSRTSRRPAAGGSYSARGEGTSNAAGWTSAFCARFAECSPFNARFAAIAAPPGRCVGRAPPACEPVRVGSAPCTRRDTGRAYRRRGRRRARR
jgi:hypothetical protein